MQNANVDQIAPAAGTFHGEGCSDRRDAVPEAPVVIRLSWRRRAKTFATGAAMIASGAGVWWWLTAQMPFEIVIGEFLRPPLLVAMGVFPVWGCIRIAGALSAERQLLVLDGEGCTVKRGSVRTRIHWRDVVSVLPVEAVRRRRLVYSGSSGAGAVGASVGDPRAYDPSIATERTGRGAGVELRLNPASCSGRDTYWIADEFAEPRRAVASRMERYRVVCDTKRVLRPGETAVRGMSELRERALWRFACSVLVFTLWLFVAGGYVVMFARHENRRVGPPRAMSREAAPVAASLNRAPVRLHPADAAEPTAP